MTSAAQLIRDPTIRDIFIVIAHAPIVSAPEPNVVKHLSKDTTIIHVMLL